MDERPVLKPRVAVLHDQHGVILGKTLQFRFACALETSHAQEASRFRGCPSCRTSCFRHFAFPWLSRRTNSRARPNL